MYMENKMTNTMQKRFEEEAKSWVKGQQGSYMCLGNCQKCNFHSCHGCLCSFIPFIQSEIDLAVANREKTLKLFHKMELQAIALKSLEEFMIWKDLLITNKTEESLQAMIEKTKEVPLHAHCRCMYDVNRCTNNHFKNCRICGDFKEISITNKNDINK